MHVLLGARRRAPAEVAHDLRAVGEGLVGPEPHRARCRDRVGRRPVHLSWLLLHHPERDVRSPALGLERPAEDVVVEGDQVGVPGPRVARLDLVGERRLLEHAERVAVPGDAVERAPERVDVVIREEPHPVVGDGAAGRARADLGDLPLVEGDDGVRREAREVEPGAGRRLGDGTDGQLDLVERPVGHGPELGPPRFVQRVDGAVAVAQPGAEAAERGGAVRADGVVAAVLVVDLPGAHRLVAAVALGQGRGDARGLLAVALVGEVVVPARAEAADAPVGAHGEHVGHAVDEPLGGRGGRGAQHHLQPRGAEAVDRPVHPPPVEAAGIGLQQAPGELADAHPVEADALHAGGVLGPGRFGPVFGVVADAEARGVEAFAHGISPSPRRP